MVALGHSELTVIRYELYIAIFLRVISLALESYGIALVWAKLPLIVHNYAVLLKHWGQDKMANISQTTFLIAFFWMKIY